MLFSEAYLSQFAKIDKPSFMIAAYPNKAAIDLILAYQKKLNLDRAEKILTGDELHVTLRHWPKEKFTDVEAVKKYLKKNFEHKEYVCTVGQVELLGKDRAFTISLTCKELNSLQKDIDAGIQGLGVPASTFSSFKCHLSLAYGYPDIPNMQPPFEKITLDKIKLVNNDDVVFAEI